MGCHSWPGVPGPRLCVHPPGQPWPRRPGATLPPRKFARNFPRSVFDMPGKRWNCNDPISKFEIWVGELRATFVGNRAGVWGTMRVPLLPRPRRGFTDREDWAEGLVLRGRVGLRVRGAPRQAPRRPQAPRRAPRRTQAPRRIAGPTPDAGPHAAGSASADKAGPASVGTRGLARSREAATPRSAARSRARTVRGRRLVSRAR